MTSQERIARDVGWLQGFSATVWALVGEKMADETAAEYDEVVGELYELLMAKVVDE